MIRLQSLEKYPEIYQGLLSSQHSDNRIDIIKLNHGVSFFYNNTRLFNSHDALLLFEKECSPVLYVPKSDIFQRHFLRSTNTSYCPYKGEASYWSLSVTGEILIDAVWEYQTPISGVEIIEDHVAFANHHSGGEYLFYSI